MSAIAADLPFRRPRFWMWVSPVVLSLIMSMGLLVLRSSSGGGEAEFCADSQFVDSSGNHYPDESCTGVPAGTSLSAYSGANPVTIDGTTIDGKTITSCPLQIEAINVTIKNSQFNCSDANALYVDDQGMYAETSSATVFAVTVQDSEINCNDSSSGHHGVTEANIYLLRVELQGCENGLSINQNVRVEDSYIHNLSAIGGDPHSDGIEFSYGHWINATVARCALLTGSPGFANATLNITIIRNTIFGMSANDTDFETSAMIMNGDCLSDTDNLIDGNYIAGGAATLYCPGDGGDNVVITNNRFSNQFASTVGAFAPTDSCGSMPGGTFTGNVCAETGAALTAATATC